MPVGKREFPRALQPIENRALRMDDLRRIAQRLGQTGETPIQLRDTGEEEENPLVDPQTAMGEWTVATNFDDVPASQRRVVCERVPMRIGKGCEREAEGRPGISSRARRSSTRIGEIPFQLHSGTKQNHSPLKTR